MNQIKFLVLVRSLLQRQQNKITRRLFAMGLALVGALLLALPAAGQALPEAQTIAFEVEGTWVSWLTNVYANFHGGDISGDSSLGSFTATYLERGWGNGRIGSATLVYPHGTLTIDYDYRKEVGTGTPTAGDVWTGTYVVSGGTGSLEGVTGEGVIVVISGFGTGPFFLSGTLSR